MSYDTSYAWQQQMKENTLRRKAYIQKEYIFT